MDFKALELPRGTITATDVSGTLALYLNRGGLIHSADVQYYKTNNPHLTGETPVFYADAAARSADGRVLIVKGGKLKILR